MIGLADCNNFYASCERVFNPKLNNKPVIVLSNNDGCVIARSNEAKLLGVKMGEPAFKIKSLIKNNDIAVFSTNFALYGDFSDRVMSILKSEIDNVEVYSIDEAFLDFQGIDSLAKAEHIIQKVKKWTGIPISIGIAPTKVLAKLANTIAKKYTKKGVFLLDSPQLISRALSFFSVDELWGIGSRYAKRLKHFGINTALDLRNTDRKWLRKNFSINAVHLQKELYGKSIYELELKKVRKKNICTSRSFFEDISNYSRLKQAISKFANNCASKLRKEKSCCSCVTVFLRTNFFKQDKKQYFPAITLNFSTPTNDSMEIVSIANIALKKIYKKEFNYKKAGVIVQNIIPEDYVQMSLFDQINRKSRRKIMSSIDKINLLMGRDKIYLASQSASSKIEMKQQRLSPCYTTRFADVLKIKI
tara:strand:+ start:279 stop:1529 length:1251 start_codon:yes stop_codon:yes gene_type:complete